MRISDWSSDVCSSDLRARLLQRSQHRRQVLAQRQLVQRPARAALAPGRLELRVKGRRHRVAGVGVQGVVVEVAGQHAHRVGRLRSEEHTSELQSLMRISYAVFCLKKKNKKRQ